MKRKIVAALMVAGLLAGGSLPLLAQNGPGKGRNGCGYGGPPQSQEERAARQAACLEKNGGVCPNGGPKAQCPGGGWGRGNGKGQGPGQGQGQGHGWRRGLRDGTGPRGGTGACPQANPQSAGN